MSLVCAPHESFLLERMQEPKADRAFNSCRFGKFLETERWVILCELTKDSAGARYRLQSVLSRDGSSRTRHARNSKRQSTYGRHLWSVVHLRFPQFMEYPKFVLDECRCAVSTFGRRSERQVGR